MLSSIVEYLCDTNGLIIDLFTIRNALLICLQLVVIFYHINYENEKNKIVQVLLQMNQVLGALQNNVNNHPLALPDMDEYISDDDNDL